MRSIVVIALMLFAMTVSAQQTINVDESVEGGIWKALTSISWPAKVGETQEIILGNTRTIVTRRDKGVDVLVYRPNGQVTEALGVTNFFTSRSVTYQVWKELNK